MLRRSIAIVVLATAVVALSVQVVGGHPDSQSWYLLDSSSEGHEQDYTGTKASDGTIHHKDFFMNKTGNAAGSYMQLPNVTEKTTWWYAEYPAQFDGLTFGEDDWTVNISHSNPGSSPCTIFANVSRVDDSTGEVTYLANGSESASSSGVTIITCYDNPNTQQIFNTGERLALRIYHNRAATLRIYYYNATDGRYSNLTSPSSDPGYPVPELLPLILFATGLLALVGYVTYSSRRRRKEE